MPSLRIGVPEAALAWLRRLAPAALLFIGIAASWETVTRLGLVSPLILPAPSEIARTFVAQAPRLFTHLGWTALAALGGFALGNVLGFLLAVVFVHSRPTRVTVLPLAMMAQAVPIVAVAPALLLWLGNGVEPLEAGGHFPLANVYQAMNNFRWNRGVVRVGA